MQKLLVTPKKQFITNEESSNTPLADCDISKGIYRQEVSSKVVVRIKGEHLKDFTNINLLSVQDTSLEFKAILQSDVYLTSSCTDFTIANVTFVKQIKLEGIGNCFDADQTNRPNATMFNAICKAEENKNVGFSLISTDGKRNNLIQYVRDPLPWTREDFGLHATKESFIELTFYTSALVGQV